MAAHRQMQPFLAAAFMHPCMCMHAVVVMIVTLIPCILDIALKGRRARRVLIVLNAWIPPAPNREAVKFINDTCMQTITTRIRRSEI